MTGRRPGTARKKRVRKRKFWVKRARGSCEMMKLVLASRNQKKMKEMNDILSGMGV